MLPEDKPWWSIWDFNRQRKVYQNNYCSRTL